MLFRSPAATTTTPMANNDILSFFPKLTEPLTTDSAPPTSMAKPIVSIIKSTQTNYHKCNAVTTAVNNPQATANTSTCSSSSSTGHDLIMAGQTDGVSVSYEYTDSVVVVASASVSFNIAEAGFDTSSAS